MSALNSILARQRAWAEGQGIELDPPDYTARLEDNLYSKLSERSLEEYGGAAGQELVDSPAGKPAKMRALESSSALVLNVFEHLRQTNLKARADEAGRRAKADEKGGRGGRTALNAGFGNGAEGDRRTGCGAAGVPRGWV